MPIESIEALTTRALSVALDAASLRHQVIASNIAHANTPGYAAQRVSFEGLLDAGLAAARGGAAQPPLRARTEPLLAADGSPQGVAVDMEMAALTQNTLHQQALLKALQRHLGLMTSAVSEGKR